MPSALLRCVLPLLMCVAAAGELPAQESRIKIVVAGAQRLRDDLKSLVDMAPPNLRKNWGDMEENLKAFETGVDPARPIRLDVVFGGSELAYIGAVPVGKLEGKDSLLENIDSFGYRAKLANGLYTLTQPPPARSKSKAAAAPPQKPLFMRNVHGYGLIAAREKDVPANAPDPLLDIKPLLERDFDVFASIENDPKSLDQRRAKFKELRKQVEAAIQFKRGEPEADFEARKMSIIQNFNEAERFVVESASMLATWTTDIAKKEGRGEFKLTAIPNTSLFESIQLLAQTPSRFAHVKLHAPTILSGKVNFAIDPLRTSHAQEMYAKLRPVMKGSMDDRPALNAAGKAAAKQAIDHLFDLLESSVPLKVVDGFIDVHPSADGKNTGVFGVRAGSPDKAVAALAMFPKIRDGWKFQSGVGEHAGVTFHALTVAPHRHDEFQAVFGGEPVLYFGTSEDVVWGAAGQNALEELKAAIDQSQTPAESGADPTILQAAMKYGPWVSLLEIYRDKEPKKTDRESVTAEKQNAKIRKLAKDVFAPGDDLLQMALQRNGDAVEGTLEINEGVLRYVGSMIAHLYAEYAK